MCGSGILVRRFRYCVGRTFLSDVSGDVWVGHSCPTFQVCVGRTFLSDVSGMCGSGILVRRFRYCVGRTFLSDTCLAQPFTAVFTSPSQAERGICSFLLQSRASLVLSARETDMTLVTF